MPKLVCDFATVTEEANNLKTSGETMKTDISTYKGNIEKDLEKWNSESKDSFNFANGAQIDEANSISEYAKSLGEFIAKASKAIEDLDNQLANIKIK